MRGFISLSAFRGCSYRLYGGPYTRKPENMVGVKMAAESNLPCEVSIPTRDYCTPDLTTMAIGLERTVELILSGVPVYAGCAGGIGRTGLLLALVAKAWGIEDPVAYVRSNYYAHAVETKEQMSYVADFPIDSKIKYMIFWAKTFNLFKKNKILTIV